MPQAPRDNTDQECDQRAIADDNTCISLINQHVHVNVDDTIMQHAPTAVNLSLCGCGFLGIYHLGVASCFTQYGTSFLGRVERVVGASAGSLVASALIVNIDKLKECIKFTYDLAAELRAKPAGALTPGYSLMKPLRNFLDSSLPEDAHLRASGKLYISLTNVKTRKNEIFSQYDNRQELIKCLLASSYIPVYAGIRPPKIRGKRYMDGGFTDNLPIFSEGHTVKISPFSGGQEISPKDKRGLGLFVNIHKQDFQVNRHNIVRGLHALFPPTRDTLTKYYTRGFQDAQRFLKEQGLFEDKLKQTSPQTTVISVRETDV